MLCRCGGALFVSVGRGEVINVISELVTQSDRVGMIMMVRSGLMRQRGIKSDAFVDISVTVPIAGSHDVASAVPIVGIAVVKERNAVDEITDCAKASECFRGGNRWIAWDAIERFRVSGIIWEKLCLRGVEIPRPHHVTRQAAGVD